MLSSQLTGLLDSAPAGVTDALAVVDGFDAALERGLARLDPASTEALAGLADAMAATPLGPAVGEAVDKLATGSVADGHIAALAGARTALLGAVHDALLSGLDTARGQARDPLPAAGAPAPAAGNVLAGSRSWLTELAITGWLGVDRDIASGGGQTIEALLSDPARRRLAVLLDGLAAELQASCPIAAMGDVPARRWADLWTRAVVLSQDGGPLATAAPATEASGRLLPLGADVHEHGTAVQVQVHAVFEPAGGGAARLVRATVAAAKVDAVVGPAVWKLFADHPVLLGALAGQQSVDITGMPLLDSGDLLWDDGRAAPGEPADPFATARLRLTDAAASAVPALDRHPVRIAEPVLVEGYKATKPKGDGPPKISFVLDGVELPVDTGRLPAAGPLTAKLVAASSACIGLMRWDAGGWALQPLGVQTTVKRQPTVLHNGDWALGPTDPKVAKAEARNDALAVLQERAGRLLRK
ncbi:hypothetical protein ACFOVU_25960 [Nocardiopsis sediminis]|uniref:Uncharacterized protein n=1 Tax=Nocardiopsis sediminis TaxID=1778267 RepID=A0ABV8FVP7_9ACTN